MPLIKFGQFLSESGDLQLLHTAANISVPKIHSTEGGAHVAVHRTSTAEHADWLKGKFEKALKSNPSRAHIKVEVKHDDSGHSVHVTHTPPKKLKESLLVGDEKRFNKGDHVHLENGRSNVRVIKHGVVHSSNNRSAHVKWEDGTESKHLHSSGRKVGQERWDDHRINHNLVVRPGTTWQMDKLSNEDHKEHLKKVDAANQAKQEHISKHRSAIEKLSTMHHSELKPHHLEAIHDILDRAKSGHD